MRKTKEGKLRDTQQVGIYIRVCDIQTPRMEAGRTHKQGRCSALIRHYNTVAHLEQYMWKGNLILGEKNQTNICKIRPLKKE